MITCIKSLTHFLTTQWFASRVRFRACIASVRDLSARGADFRPIHATLLLLIMLSAMAAFSPVSLAQTHVGEDGIEYEISETTGAPDSAARQNWMLGKVEPVLVDESIIDHQLNVIVYVLRAPAHEDAQDP